MQHAVTVYFSRPAFRLILEEKGLPGREEIR